MISCVIDLPFLDLGNGYLVPLQRRWVAGELRRAANETGQSGPWWPADQVTEGLVRWLERRDAPGTVSIEDLEQRLRAALEGIGLGEIAGSLALERPPLRIDLLEWIEADAAWLELDLFRTLGERLDQLLACGFHSFAFVHLEEAIDRICPRTRRSARWDQLHHDTLAFLCHRTESQAA